MASVLDYSYRAIQRDVGVTLVLHGFVQQGSVFRILSQGNCGIVEFQRSAKSSKNRLLFTVNVGVVCGELLSSERELREARIIDAHLRLRIGMFLPDHPDKWWEITDSASVDAAAKEVRELILQEALPYVLKHLDTGALVVLWKSGQSPGLTALECARYLAALTKHGDRLVD